MKTARQFLQDFITFGRSRIAAGAGLLGLVTVLEAAGVLLLIDIAGQIGLQVRPGLGLSFATVLMLYVAAVAARSVLERAHSRMTDRLQAGFSAHLRRRLYAALAFADWNFHARHRVADSVHALTQEADHAGAAAHYLQQMIAGAALAVVYVALALWISSLLTLVIMSGGLLLVMATRRSTQRAVNSGEVGSTTSQAMHRAIAEHFSGMKTARSYGREKQHVDAFDAVCGDVETASAMVARTSSGVRQRLELGSVVLMATLVYAARELVHLSAGETLLLMFAYARLIPRVTGLMVQATSWAGLLPSYRRMVELERSALAAAEMRATEQTSRMPFKRTIRLESVSLAYPEQTRSAVAGVNLEIRRGTTVAIVGESGAGKSTCADLIAGLLHPTAGRVLIDVTPLTAANVAEWRSQVGYVTQDTFLFHDTIRANLLWAAPGSTDADVARALDRAALSRAVRSWPRGLDTIAGDRGVLLSGGERQRLALARALLRKPSVLVLDEATSALDADSEAQVLDAIADIHGHLTIIVITHRLSAVRGADRVYVMDDGRIVESVDATGLARQPMLALTR